MFNKKFFSIAQLTLFAILLFSISLIAQDYKEFKETFSLSSSGTVSIETYKGSITVETWDKDEVYFYAKVEPDMSGWNGTSPEEQLVRCEVKFDHSGNYLNLKSKYEKDHGLGSETLALVHYTIKMPATAQLRIDDYKSKTHIKDLHSDLNLETYKGTVNIANFSGEIDLETYKGNVEIEFAEFKDNCKLDTYKGDFILSIPSDSKFNFDFELGKKGDFTSDFEMAMNRYKSDDGEIEGNVNGGGPKIEFSTYKGEIELRKK